MLKNLKALLEYLYLGASITLLVFILEFSFKLILSTSVSSIHSIDHPELV